MNRNVHCALTKCKNRGEGANGWIQAKITQIKNEKYKIERIHGESQCLFQRKIATRWLSRWSRQLPQHHLLFVQRNIYFFPFSVNPLSIWKLSNIKWKRSPWRWYICRICWNKKVKVKANIIRGCLTQGSLVMAAHLSEGSRIRRKPAQDV